MNILKVQKLLKFDMFHIFRLQYAVELSDNDESLVGSDAVLRALARTVLKYNNILFFIQIV